MNYMKAVLTVHESKELDAEEVIDELVKKSRKL